MSLPEFPKTDPCLTTEQAINMILTSIAMEELALSHILEEESGKIKQVVNCLSCNCSCESMKLVIETNNSVSRLMEKVMDNQLILKNKMEKALDALPKHKEDCHSCHSCQSCHTSPCPPCCCEHEADRSSGLFEACPMVWCRNTALHLTENRWENHGTFLSPTDCSRILLPGCGQYFVQFQLHLGPIKQWEPLRLEFCLNDSCRVPCSHSVECDHMGNNYVIASAVLTAEQPFPHSQLSLLLNAPRSVEVFGGNLQVEQLSS